LTQTWHYIPPFDASGGPGVARWIRDPWETTISIGSGVVFALLVMVGVILLSGPHDPAAGTTTVPAATTTVPEATTTTTSTTTLPSPTTTLPSLGFEDDTEPKVNETIEGEPGPSLTNVRFGAHPGYTRIVLDFVGHGVPEYFIRYETGPFLSDGAGEPVEVEGDAFLAVTITPGATYDPEDMSPTYEGHHRLVPRLDPIVEMVLTGDFEATLTWVIGLTDQKGFRVFVLDDPLRVVIDIAS
jgi:hypothetical protein